MSRIQKALQRRINELYIISMVTGISESKLKGYANGKPIDFKDECVLKAHI